MLIVPSQTRSSELWLWLSSSSASSWGWSGWIDLSYHLYLYVVNKIISYGDGRPLPLFYCRKTRTIWMVYSQKPSTERYSSACNLQIQQMHYFYYPSKSAEKVNCTSSSSDSSLFFLTGFFINQSLLLSMLKHRKCFRKTCIFFIGCFKEWFINFSKDSVVIFYA